MVHAAYVGDHHVWLFYPGKPDAAGEVRRLRDGSYWKNHFFAYSESWFLYLGVADLATRSAFWSSLHPLSSWGHFPVTCTSFADRSYWNRRTRRRDFRQWTGAALQHIVSPGRKSWLHDQYLFDYFDQVGGGLLHNQRWNAVFFDGSASTSAAGGEAYFNGDGDHLERWPFHGIGHPDGRHTINGVAGVDR
jgi:hypothetical protein